MIEDLNSFFHFTTNVVSDFISNALVVLGATWFTFVGKVVLLAVELINISHCYLYVRVESYLSTQ